MAFEYTSGAGLAIFSMGISFLLNRINFIKKGNIAIATVVKLEEFLDSENTKYYIPHFTFTSHSFREITYKHRSTQSKLTWKPGDQVKVAYKEGYFDDHEIVLLTFLNAFGFSVLLLTVGIILLIVAGYIYWNASYPYEIVVRTFWGTYSKSIILLSAGFIPFIAGILHFLVK